MICAPSFPRSMPTPPHTDRSQGYNPMTEAPTVPMTPKDESSVVDDFLEIIPAPSKVYERRAAPEKGFGMHMLIVSVLAAVFAFAGRSAFSAMFDAEFTRGAQKALEKNPQMTQDMIDKMRPMQEGIATILTYVGTPIFIFVIALLCWIAARLVGAKLPYGKVAMIVTLAWVPRLIGQLVVVVQALLMDATKITSAASLSLTPARFMDPDVSNPKLFALLGNLDPFAIWCYALIGIGIAVVARVPRSKGYLAAAIAFIVGSLPSLFR